MAVHLSLMIFIILLNLFPLKNGNRKKKILPISFLLIAIYFAIRYNYGLDFFRYYQGFTSGREDFFEGEILFYRFLHLFPYYYQFIIVYAVIVVGTLYYIVRKYVKEEFYAIFFLLFFCMSGMSFNMLSAYRTTIAASILWLGIDFFYLKKKGLPLFIATVVFAYFFHNSAIVFVLLPLLVFIIDKIDWKIAFFVLFIVNILSMRFSTDMFRWISSSNDFISVYTGYTKSVENATFFGVLHKSLWYVPAFLILKNKKQFDTRPLKVIYSLSYIYFFLFFFGLTVQERFTVYLFIFTIIALSMIFKQLQSDERLLLVATLTILCVYGLYLFYRMMAQYLTGKYEEGNYLFYHTIFEQPFI